MKTLQDILNDYTPEMLVADKPALSKLPNIADAVYQFDPWKRDAFVRAFLMDLGIDFWRFSDPRIHLLIDLQYLSHEVKQLRKDRLMMLVRDYGLREPSDLILAQAKDNK